MFLQVYGMTTYRTNVGLSTSISVPINENVIGTQISFYSGGTLFIAGQSLNAADVVSLGTFVQTSQENIIYGPAAFWMTAVGATCIVQLRQFLGQGFDGSY